MKDVKTNEMLVTFCLEESNLTKYTLACPQSDTVKIQNSNLLLCYCYCVSVHEAFTLP